MKYSLAGAGAVGISGAVGYREWLKRRYVPGAPVVEDRPGMLAAGNAKVTQRRRLGRTNLQVSVVSIGAGGLEGPEPIARRVRDHLARLAARELARRARLQAATIGRKVTRITVRDTKSRWGSCSAAGSLSFSWRLIMAPEPVLDYVVAHEVAHLIEMNHGPRFWRLVRTMVADPAAQRAWLKRHRAELLSYG